MEFQLHEINGAGKAKWANHLIFVVCTTLKFGMEPRRNPIQNFAVVAVTFLIK